MCNRWYKSKQKLLKHHVSKFKRCLQQQYDTICHKVQQRHKVCPLSATIILTKIDKMVCWPMQRSHADSSSENRQQLYSISLNIWTVYLWFLTNKKLIIYHVKIHKIKDMLFIQPCQCSVLWECIVMFCNEILYIVFPLKYVHGYVVLCLVLFMLYFGVESYDSLTYILQSSFIGIEVIEQLPQCQCSNPEW